MNQWTNVNASIIFDGFHDMIPNEEELGRICSVKDKDRSHWKDSKLPCGTEGSLKYNICKDSDNEALTIIVFFGRLRGIRNNHRNSFINSWVRYVDEILSYFKSIVSKRNISSGLLEIEISYEKTFVYRYSHNSKGWERVIKMEYENDSHE